MKQLLTAVITLFIGSNIATAQTCNCETNFQWVKKTFEENDAGFQYAITRTGKGAYAAHNDMYLEKVKAAPTLAACTQLLYDWLTFFRSGHISIKSLQKSSAPAAPAQPNAATVNNWPTITVDVPAFEKYLATKKTADYEGIWETKPYKIGIKKDATGYVGFIIETDAETWKPGHVKLRIRTDSGKLRSTFYIRDRSAQESNTVEMLGSNYLQVGRFTLKRLAPTFATDKAIEQNMKAITSNGPYLEPLNATTLILRIPTFSGSEKKKIDSVIKANATLLSNTENLVIDIRNNGGGSDGSYREIIPYIYTNPIRIVGVEYFSTPLNNKRMLDFINNPEYGFDSADKKWAKESYDQLAKRVGQFVNLDTTIVSIDKLDKVSINPKNVGIIINENNGSTAEQFLLAAKQSKKVKLFGTTTWGVLDISNMYFVPSPCNEFELGYSLTRSMRIPEMTIDKKGIQPDYYIDKSIPQHQWIEFVSDVLNGK